MRILLPSGLILTARVLTKPWELATGLMGVRSMPLDHGVLFVHPKPSFQTYWTFGCQFPLDIAWLDEHCRVVELCENVPPCPSRDTRLEYCPRYGGNALSTYVLETNPGVLGHNGVGVGSSFLALAEWRQVTYGALHAILRGEGWPLTRNALRLEPDPNPPRLDGF